MNLDKIKAFFNNPGTHDLLTGRARLVGSILPVHIRRLVAQIKGRGTVNRQFVLLLFALTLAGCQSGGLSNYSSPRVTGQVLAADTRQPLPDVTVQRVVSSPTDGEATPPKGAQLLTRPDGVRTDTEGRFTLDEVRVVTLFRHRGWHSATVSFACNGYESFETNFTSVSFKERSPEGVPLVNAGDILLKPKSPGNGSLSQ